MKRKRKQICVIGLGQFGKELAQSLARHCEVLAIDTNQDVVDQISEEIQRAVCLDGRDFDSLSSVVTNDFDEAIIGTSMSIESSILCALHLKKIGVRRISAKAQNEDHATILRAIGVDNIIFPEREAAQRLSAHIVDPNLLDFVPLSEDYRVIELISPEDFHNQNLADLNLRRQYGVFVLAIKKNGPSGFVFLPGPTYRIVEGDILVLIGKEDDLIRIERV